MKVPQSLFDNVLAAARLVLLMPVRREAFRISLDQAILLMLLGTGSYVALSYLLTDPPREYDPSALPHLALEELATILGVYLAARLFRAPWRALQLFCILTAAGLWTTAIMLPVLTIAEEGSPASRLPVWVEPAALALFPIWAIVVTFRAIRLVWPRGLCRAVLALGTILSISWGLAFAYPPDSPWYTTVGSDPAAGGSFRVNVEETYRVQRDLLDAAEERLAPQRRGVTDLYFVGFGGYSDQDVFMREVLSVRDLFDERFDTQDRSLALINNTATLDTFPLANVTNLEAVLELIGARINPEEDVLFLYLTSHGSEDHRLVVDFWPLGLNDLTPEILKDMLDGAGIKWRVIVVSACYSGGFIEPLKDDNSLILSAARADRTSFGCSNESEFTYFGAAYFDQALRRGSSFIQGFEHAREAIELREEAEQLTPSKPQIHLGPAIMVKLGELEDRLARRRTLVRP